MKKIRKMCDDFILFATLLLAKVPFLSLIFQTSSPIAGKNKVQSVMLWHPGYLG